MTKLGHTIPKIINNIHGSVSYHCTIKNNFDWLNFLKPFLNPGLCAGVFQHGKVEIIANDQVQPDQINMTVLFWSLVSSDLSSVGIRTRHILQGTTNTRPCITGHPIN